MSRIGKKPIEVPGGVSVSISPGRVTVNGPLGELQRELPVRMKVEQTDAQITDLASPRLGGVADEYGMFHAGTAGSLIETAAASWLLSMARNG